MMDGKFTDALTKKFQFRVSCDFFCLSAYRTSQIYSTKSNILWPLSRIGRLWLWDIQEKKKLGRHSVNSKFETQLLVRRATASKFSIILVRLQLLKSKKASNLLQTQCKHVQLVAFFSKVFSASACISCIVYTPQSFSVNKPVYPKEVKYTSVFRRPVLDCLKKHTVCLEEKTTNLLPDFIALIFDGWSFDLTHFIDIFATFIIQNSDYVTNLLFGNSVLYDESSQDASKIHEILLFVRSEFGKDQKHFAPLFGDNTNTNRACSRQFGCFLHCVVVTTFTWPSKSTFQMGGSSSGNSMR